MIHPYVKLDSFGLCENSLNKLISEKYADDFLTYKFRG